MPTEPTWQPPTSQPTKTRKPWYRRWWAIALVALVVFFFIGQINSSDHIQEPTRAAAPVVETATETETVAPEPPPALEPPAELPGIGVPVQDGKFTFTVEEFTCGATEVGSNEFLTEQAQGQFCIATVNVTNSGDAAQTMFAENQYLYNQEGQKFSADGQATFYANTDASGNSLLLEEINPGNALRGVVVFDVPLGFLPGHLELHDSVLSGGAEVRVG